MSRPCARPLLIFLTVITLSTPTHVPAYEFEGIPILPKVFDPPYNRGLYKHWIDADGDREDTRQEVLIEESLQPATIRTKPNGRRKVVEGLWVGPFTGTVTTDPHPPRESATASDLTCMVPRSPAQHKMRTDKSLPFV